MPRVPRPQMASFLSGLLSLFNRKLRTVVNLPRVVNMRNNANPGNLPNSTSAFEEMLYILVSYCISACIWIPWYTEPPLSVCLSWCAVRRMCLPFLECPWINNVRFQWKGAFSLFLSYFCSWFLTQSYREWARGVEVRGGGGEGGGDRVLHRNHQASTVWVRISTYTYM